MILGRAIEAAPYAAHWSQLAPLGRGDPATWTPRYRELVERSASLEKLFDRSYELCEGMRKGLARKQRDGPHRLHRPARVEST